MGKEEREEEGAEGRENVEKKSYFKFVCACVCVWMCVCISTWRGPAEKLKSVWPELFLAAQFQV